MLLSRYRSWLFTLFVALFGLTAALVLFFAFGYRYSFERGIFIFSGSITVKTIPEVVDITIDGESIPRKRLGLLNNSIHIAGLMPGEHVLRITAPGYLPWEKRVVIESGISREFWNIVLPSQTYPLTPLPNTETTQKIFPHPNRSDRLVLVKESAGETSLVLMSTTSGEAHQIFALANSRFDETSRDNLEWSWFSEGRFILLPLFIQDQARHLVVDTNDGSFFTLEERLGLEVISLARWETGRSNELLFMSGTTLYRLNIGNGALTNLGEDILTYSLSDDTLYLVTKTGEVWREDGDRLVTITPSLNVDHTVPLSLTVYDENTLALLEEGGERRLLVVYPDLVERKRVVKEVGRGIESIQFSNDGKKLLFASHTEISVIFTSEWEVQPRRKAGEVVQVARFSDPIQHVQWAENYEHVVFSLGSVVKFIELDGRDQRQIANLAALERAPTQILPLFADNHLFLILPGQSIQSLTFPEPQGLFGQ